MLQLLAGGMTAAAIAVQLNLSPNTVCAYQRTGLQRLGYPNRRHYAAAALESWRRSCTFMH